MTVDFAAPALRGAYGDREVSAEWLAWCRAHLAPAGRDVADIGCGGGIYSRGFARAGAASVVGVDRSPQYVAEARAAGAGLVAMRFIEGDAAATGLPDASIDLVFCRAVIHHLSAGEQAAAAAEWRRILRPGGLCAVQDRTADDASADDPAYWVRATLFRTFPRLLATERARRPDRAAYAGCLDAAGFEAVTVATFAETRRTYADFPALEAEILARKGKSILHELSDAELALYAARLGEAAGAPPLVERDPWTVWLARKG
ncbi:MAG: class I SAM-dependent methyltransferase [Alphaproteobacteria bacterium]|nr:class I SAM-dependent methyltransferase [Alphaproteobacteria bacterium]MCB9929572.1 class I SAM-dependent methyltransferase [Alphaproteobacteria bacterium]